MTLVQNSCWLGVQFNVQLISRRQNVENIYVEVSKPKWRLRLPIAFKLVSLTILVLLGATVPIAFKSAQLFETVSSRREEDANREQANARALEVEGILLSYVDKIKICASLMMREYSDPEERRAAMQLAFRQDREIVSIEVLKVADGGAQEPVTEEVNEELLKPYNLDRKYLADLRQTVEFPFSAVFSEQLQIRNSSTSTGAPLMTVGLPLVKDQLGKVTHIAVANILLARMQKTFGLATERTLFLVDEEGTVLAHPNDRLAIERRNVADLSIVRQALKSETRVGQLRYREDNEDMIGAYARTNVGLAVIAQAPEAVILEPARNVRRQAFFITGIALSAALFIIFVFSITLTTPIERLVEFSKEIAKGNFKIQSNIKTRDEVGELALAFDQMVVGLEERDRVKNVLNKFHGSTVAQDLLKNDLQLGGSRKQVTVFFSDIRDFTKFSEGHSPEEVVAMLNEYFHVMVGIINRHGGVVDKFIGDAIMAVWGAPTSSGHDELDAAKACIEMRKALYTLNQDRLKRKLTEIRIGMALHSGSAISGTIGTDERMEYTVIGDTVNMTSRLEASTKAFGTDFLISETTANTIGDKFIVELAGSAEVKGKSQPLKMFKVLGYIDEAGKSVEVKTPYSEYAAEAADKIKVA